MGRPILFIVDSDPRTSPRPAEAIRIAAGVGAWQKAEVSLYLAGAAVLALGEFVDDLIDDDNFTRYLPIIAEWGRPIYVPRGEARLAEIADSPWRTEAIDAPALARIVHQSAFLLRF